LSPVAGRLSGVSRYLSTRSLFQTSQVVGVLAVSALSLGIASLSAASPALGANLAAAGPARTSTLTASASSVVNGASITFSYSTPAATVNSTNWIGLYSPGQTPGDVSSTTWQYAPGARGKLAFATTDLNGVGRYVAYYLYDNGYQILAGPVAFAVTPSRPAPAPVFERSFGHFGAGALTSPFGIAVDRQGQVWVTDRAANLVEKFAPSGRLLARFGPGTLLHPDGIAVSWNGNVWVSDTGHDRIVEFSPAGVKLKSFGSAGSANGRLDQPADLLVASAGDIYIADKDNNRVEEFSPAGRYLRSISVPTPWGLALSPSGDLWVSSPSYAAGNGVYEFSRSGSQLEAYGSTQASYGALSNPAGLAIGPEGRIYVAQPDYGFVTVLNTDGSFYTEFGLQQNTALGAEDLAFPQDLAFGPDGSVFVADSGNGRIVEFAPPGARTPGSAGTVPTGIVPTAPGRPGLPTAIWLALLAALLGAATALGSAARRRRPASIRPAPAAAEPARELVVSRRALIAGATVLTGAAVGAGVLPASLRRALAVAAERPAAGRLTDIKHIVILMQENRSFDHYYGTMPGVRGFSDPTAITLSTGKPVFYQPDPSHAQGYLLPFHYDTKSTSAQATPGTDHSWPTQHQAWHGGKMDQWIAAKGEYTMGYFTEEDIPFHRALAEAFTICDNYHCSVFGPTNPNRLYMWTGMIDPQGKYGGPVIDNTPAFDNVILSWKTYPERLEAAGISWRVYQEEDNYDDNALAWFKQYGNAPTSSPLYQRGLLKLPAGAFEYDARHDRLPQVSWLVAPTAQTEHPDYFPAAGAEYIAQKLDAIASNPEVWAKTAFILCYDENDGMFDHVPPPVAPRGTAAEFVDGLNIGLGFRTPTTIVSPWTAGGFVCSDVFDHSSLVRFIEARFGVSEPNLSAWRRRTCGDLTSAFRFASGPASYPSSNTRLRLATAEAGLLTAQQEVNDNPSPEVPVANQPLPAQRA
jgi:phospholipase C